MSGRVVHFEIPYDDGDRSRAFYSSVFGWEMTEMPETSYTLIVSGPSGEQGPDRARIHQRRHDAAQGAPSIRPISWSRLRASRNRSKS